MRKIIRIIPGSQEKGGEMTQPEKKTIEQIAAMSGAERSRYLRSLSHDERQAINAEKLLKAIDTATVQMLKDDLNAETDDKS
jgi:hypothetical protein